MSDIYAVKLITGEEIIGKKVPGMLFKMERVRMIQMIQTGPQSVGVGLMPFFTSDVDAEIEFHEHALVTTPKPVSKDMENLYIQQTSGIQLATGNVLRS